MAPRIGKLEVGEMSKPRIFVDGMRGRWTFYIYFDEPVCDVTGHLHLASSSQALFPF